MSQQNEQSQKNGQKNIFQLDQSILNYCKSMPKAELHCHLNGAIRPATLIELAEQLPDITSNQLQDIKALIHQKSRSLQDCFELFNLIHRVTTDHGTIRRITQECIVDMWLDNVRLLELRTTPKHRTEVGMTKESYIVAVLEGINSAQEYLKSQNSNSKPSTSAQCIVKLLLSIDRRENAAAARETVDLAVKYQGSGVVGIDISGNPYVGDFKVYIGALTTARSHGLQVTVHTAEVVNEQEPDDIMNFKPDRMGHCCYLSQAQKQKLFSSKIPVELCLSSNLLTQSVKAYDEHHFSELYGECPIVLCTDDPLVFQCTLSYEYAVACQVFRLSHEQIQQLAKASFAASFVSSDEKNKILNECDFNQDKTEVI